MKFNIANLFRKWRDFLRELRDYLGRLSPYIPIIIYSVVSVGGYPYHLPLQNETSPLEPLETEPTYDILNTSEMSMKSLRDIRCEWRDPADNFKYCSVLVELHNKRGVKKLLHDIKLHGRYHINITNISYSTTYSEVLKTYQTKEGRNYTKLEKVWRGMKKGIPKHISPKSHLGVRIDFIAPIVIEGGTYKRNKFNISIIGDKDYTLDPTISGCASLTQAGATYNLTADIVDSSTSRCIKRCEHRIRPVRRTSTTS